MKTTQQFQEQFAQLFETVNALATKIERGSRPADESILDDVDLCQMLNVSKRTTATWRAERLIQHSLIKGKIYYVYADVLAFIKKYAVPTMDRSLKIKLSGREN